MTKDEIKIKVDDLINCPPDVSQPVQVYIDGFKDGANFVMEHNLNFINFKIKNKMDTITQMNKIIAEYEGKLSGIGIPISTFNYYHKSFDRLMPIAKKLNEESKYMPVSFGKNLLDFDIGKVHESVYEYIVWLNKYKQNENQNNQEI